MAPQRLPGACALDHLAGNTALRCRLSGAQEVFACTCEFQRVWEAFIKAQDPAEGHKPRKGSGGNN